MRIYIIEDDIVLRKELAKLLMTYGYECCFDDDYENIIKLSLISNPDLILLDINLPYQDGYHICREIRKVSTIPIIVVTSRETDMDEILSMNLGADDFVTKPYNKQILLARIGAVLKRFKREVSVLDYKGVSLCFDKSLIKYMGNEISLTKNEMKILNILIKNKGKIVSRDDIMNELWNSDEFIDDNTLTVNVNRLRKKLSQIGVGEYIETKRGQGYIV